MQLLGVSKRKVICFLNGALAGGYATSQQVQSTPCPGTNHDVTYCVKSEIRTAGAWVSYEMMKKWTRTTLFVNKKIYSLFFTIISASRISSFYTFWCQQKESSQYA
jgi:hypothetical protein